METTQTSNSWWIERQNATSPYNGTPFSVKINESPIPATIQMNLEKYYAEWRKPVTQDHSLHDSICMKCPGRGKSIETESRSMVAKLPPGWGEWKWLVKIFLLRLMKMFSIQLWWSLYKPVKIVKIIEWYILNCWIVWDVNYSSIKLSQKKRQSTKAQISHIYKVGTLRTSMGFRRQKGRFCLDTESRFPASRLVTRAESPKNWSHFKRLAFESYCWHENIWV